MLWFCWETETRTIKDVKCRVELEFREIMAQKKTPQLCSKCKTKNSQFACMSIRKKDKFFNLTSEQQIL